MHAFKAGDIVRCIDNNDSFLKLGVNYKVVQVDQYRQYHGDYLMLLKPNGANVGGWMARRFELVLPCSCNTIELMLRGLCCETCCYAVVNKMQ